MRNLQNFLLLIFFIGSVSSFSKEEPKSIEKKKKLKLVYNRNDVEESPFIITSPSYNVKMTSWEFAGQENKTSSKELSLDFLINYQNYFSGLTFSQESTDLSEGSKTYFDENSSSKDFYIGFVFGKKFFEKRFYLYSNFSLVSEKVVRSITYTITYLNNDSLSRSKAITSDLKFRGKKFKIGASYAFNFPLTISLEYSLSTYKSAHVISEADIAGAVEEFSQLVNTNLPTTTFSENQIGLKVSIPLKIFTF